MTNLSSKPGDAVTAAVVEVLARYEIVGKESDLALVVRDLARLVHRGAQEGFEIGFTAGLEAIVVGQLIVEYQDAHAPTTPPSGRSAGRGAARRDLDMSDVEADAQRMRDAVTNPEDTADLTRYRGTARVPDGVDGWPINNSTGR